jgi:hypothetical protein
VSPRVAIVVLLVLVVLFVVGVGVGASPGNNGPPPSPESFQPSGLLQGIGSLLSPLTPKLQLSPSRFTLQPGHSTAVAVPASDQPIREATFALETGTRVAIRYCAPSVNPCPPVAVCPPPPPPGAGASALNAQCLDLPRTGAGDPRSGSLTIQKDGGTLQLACPGVLPCAVRLE